MIAGGGVAVRASAPGLLPVADRTRSGSAKDSR